MGSSSAISEQETCRTFVMPGLRAAGWDKRQIREQYRITNGKIIVSSRRHRSSNPLVADYVLEYRDDLPLAVVEAKRTKVDAAAGIEQAKRYAQQLELPVAYATNGHEIWEIEIGGAIRQRPDFPSPDELWERFCQSEGVESQLEKEMLLAPFDASLRDYNLERKRPRYYQRIAVNRALRAIARGQRRILLTLATGTGKTMVALQLVAKLRKSGWTAGRMLRVLYLADRNILVDQPKDDYFVPAFGDVVHKISKGRAQRSREVYFALYQSLDRGDEQALFGQYEKDYFDLIIVDECHRGSAGSSSQWRQILEHFDKAVQIGLTATPIRRDDADTFGYFGNPVYEYSLRDGIEDGFLAPYRVRRVRLNIDMTGFRPSEGQRDVAGDVIPDKLYTPRQYERVLAVLDRTQAAARYLTQYLHDTDRMGKTIVFCENNDHANRMRVALNNANLDMVAQYENYACRITDADGDSGKALLDEFSKIDSNEPVIVMTSQLLTTGVDLPSVKNIVIFRRIGSMPLFKQIIGRGTRLCLEAHKGSFDIIDFVEATRLFNDPAFDGPPLRVIDDEVDERGNRVTSQEQAGDDDAEQVAEAEAEAEYETQDEGPLPDDPARVPVLGTEDDDTADQIMAQGKRIYVDGVEVYVWNDVHYQLESDGQTLRLVEYREFVRDRVLSMNLSPTDLRTQWAVARSRTALREELQSRAIESDDLMAKLGHPEADPLDLLINAAWELPLVSRAERALRVQREHQQFLESFGPKARLVLDALLDKFTEHGADELSARALRVPPFTEMGNVIELGGLFGGRDALHEAIDGLGRHLFDVG
ncbi:MAG: EcoAI/FtnUII family type I restriction enzme subunit R [Pseudonocardiaceae bacterium]